MIWLGLENLSLLLKKPNSKVCHLALPLGLGNENHHASPQSDEVIVLHPLVRFGEA